MLEIQFQTEKPYIKIEGVRYPAEMRVVGLAKYLFDNRNNWISREQLLRVSEVKDPNNMRVYMSRIRSIIEPYGFALKTNYKSGYGLFEVKEK